MVKIKIAKGWKDEVRWARVTRPPRQSEGFASPERQYRYSTGPSKNELRDACAKMVEAFKVEQAALIAERKLAARPKTVRGRWAS